MEHARPVHNSIVRASDTDRGHIQEALSQAYADGRLNREEFDERSQQLWQLRTLAELEQLTHDLGSSTGHALAMARTANLPTRNLVTGTPGARVTVSLMGYSARSGHWTCPPRHVVSATMGGITLDLTEADFTAHHTQILCFAVMGKIEILVPDDLDVRTDGVGLMGGFDGSLHRDAPSNALAGAPVVHIGGLALMGGIKVTRFSRKTRFSRRDDDDDDDD